MLTLSLMGCTKMEVCTAQKNRFVWPRATHAKCCCRSVRDVHQAAAYCALQSIWMHKTTRVFSTARGRICLSVDKSRGSVACKQPKSFWAHHGESVIHIFITDIHGIMILGLFHRMIQFLGLDVLLVEGWLYGRRQVWNEVTPSPFGVGLCIVARDVEIGDTPSKRRVMGYCASKSS